MFSRKLLMGWIFCCFAVISLQAEEVEPYYEAKGDKPMKLQKWVLRGLKIKVDHAGPAELNGKKAFKIEMTIDGDGLTYYKLPLGVTMIPGEKYFLTQKYMVSKLPAGCQLGLGVMISFYPDAKSLKDISFAYAPLMVKSPMKEMKQYISPELNAAAAVRQKKTDIKAEKITANKFLIFIRGKFKNQKVVFWLSDIALLPSKPE
jgi:hypothetical protein